MMRYVSYAFRQLRKNPGAGAIAVATLGLGIGAAAAMFGLIQGVLLTPCHTGSRTGSYASRPNGWTGSPTTRHPSGPRIAFVSLGEDASTRQMAK